MIRRALLLAGAMVCAAAWGAPQDPYAGYVYPAGGQQGTVFRVTVGGQRLRGVGEAYVSGEGVRASVVEYQGPFGPLTPAQQQELKRRLEEIRDKLSRASAQMTGTKPGGGKKPGKSPAAAAKK